MSDKPLKVAIAGLGTVGGATANLLRAQKDIIKARTGREIKLTALSALEQSVPLEDAKWYNDAAQMVAETDADVIVELIGGSGGIAKKICETALSRGKHVVTANKAMIAHHGMELAALADKAGVSFAFEASVAGGIPVIKVLREGLAANRLQKIYGILNGTCNYILTTMKETGRDFGDVLAEAQKLGYAEADPSFDIDGVDTAHKLAILAAVAFGMPVDFKAVHVEGIRNVSAVDIEFAEELGFKIKLLGMASRDEKGVVQRVHPCLVPKASPIAKVDGVFNAVVSEGDFVGRTVLEGRGAGGNPTASAVVADIIDIARGIKVPTFALPYAQMEKLPLVPMAERRGAYYIRLMVADRPGVFARIASALSEEAVSMEQIIQRARAPGLTVPVVMTVHDTLEASMLKALKRISESQDINEVSFIRIENL